MINNNSSLNTILSKNGLANSFSLTTNKHESSSIDCYMFDNFKISVQSTINLTIKLKFHHHDNRSVSNDKTFNYTQNTYLFKSDLCEGESVFMEFDTGGATLSATDKISINIFFNKSSGHLITI